MSAKNSRMRFILWIAGILAVLAMMSGAAADSEFTVTHGEYTIQQGSRLRVVGQYTPVFEQERIFYAIYGSDGKLIGAWYIEENQPAQGFSALWLPTSTLATGSYQVVIYPAYFADGKWNRSENKVKRTLTVVDHQPERWEREENYTVHYNSDGVKDVGFTVIDGDLYYFNPDGVLQTNGWASIDGNDYYFDQVGRAQTGLTHIQDNYYFFDDQGIMRTGLHEADGHLYFFGSDGKHVQGHVTLDGVNYFFGEDGKGISGRAAVDGRSMYFENGVEKPDPSLEQTSAFVRRCYSLILGRTADEGGLNNWVNLLASGSSNAATIISNFLSSEEYTNHSHSGTETVDILYNTMLNRPADEAGKEHWTGILESASDNSAVINGFCGSPEFINLCKEYGIEPGTVNVNPVNPEPAPDTARGKIEAFVKRCYKLILNRDADQGGLQGWSDALETGVGQACQIIDGFVRSPEYVNRNLSNAESVDILYQTMLNRAADEGGKAGWVDALSQGYTLQHIINGFCGSAEFTNICNEFGITAGNLQVQGVIVKREAIAPEGEEEAPVVYVNYSSEYTNEEKIRAFVEHCYEAVFGREGDVDGIEAYTQLILNGKKTPKRVAYEFIFSSEFQNNLPGNEDFIRILYKLYFDRVPGAEELTGWVQMLENGTSLEDIVNGFASSAEFKAIVNSMKE